MYVLAIASLAGCQTKPYSYILLLDNIKFHDQLTYN
jgi:hypothetical protein